MIFLVFSFNLQKEKKHQMLSELEMSKTLPIITVLG